MAQFAIQLADSEEDGSCPLCGRGHRDLKGWGLFTPDHEQPICRPCGKSLAPSMIALLDLAQTAERVGRGSRHLLTPPMESLLDLARAAENYSCAVP